MTDKLHHYSLFFAGILTLWLGAGIEAGAPLIAGIGPHVSVIGLLVAVSGLYRGDADAE
jgi:hypothetical protein